MGNEKLQVLKISISTETSNGPRDGDLFPKEKIWVVSCSDRAPNTLLSKAHKMAWFLPISGGGGERIEERELQRRGEPLPACPGKTSRLCAHSMKSGRARVSTRAYPESPGQIRLPTCVPEAPHHLRLRRKGIPFCQVSGVPGRVMLLLTVGINLSFSGIHGYM